VNRFVLDASVALAWVLDDPMPAYAAQVQDAMLSGNRALVPALWHLEIANGLAMAERRKDLTGADVEEALAEIQAATRQTVDTDVSVIPAREALANARSFQLTAYDAVYLELARREGLPLATLDKGLRAAAAKAGIQAL
jgi:predicted nucleic acid-binding protein